MLKKHLNNIQKYLDQGIQFIKFRFAHLEEIPKRKPVWVGDSYMVYTDVEGREEQRNKH